MLPKEKTTWGIFFSQLFSRVYKFEWPTRTCTRCHEVFSIPLKFQMSSTFSGCTFAAESTCHQKCPGPWDLNIYNSGTTNISYTLCMQKKFLSLNLSTAIMITRYNSLESLHVNIAGDKDKKFKNVGRIFRCKKSCSHSILATQPSKPLLLKTNAQACVKISKHIIKYLLSMPLNTAAWLYQLFKTAFIGLWILSFFFWTEWILTGMWIIQVVSLHATQFPKEKSSKLQNSSPEI